MKSRATFFNSFPSAHSYEVEGKYVRRSHEADWVSQHTPKLPAMERDGWDGGRGARELQVLLLARGQEPPDISPSAGLAL